MQAEYGLIVIGAGAAGLTAAFTALGFGKKVLIVEQAKPGGECTWSGCIPSKSLINIARDVHAARKFSPDICCDTAVVMNQVRAVIDTVYAEETPEKLMAAGADYVTGAARFIDSHTIEVAGATVRGRKFIVATGSSPLVPAIDGLQTVDYLTNESVFELARLPASMLILGGGAIGIELAQALNRLGVQIQLVEMMPEIMFREEPRLARYLRQRLSAEGVVFHLASKAVSAAPCADGVSLRIVSNGDSQTLRAETLLLALGRQPNTAGLGLEALGISADKGIPVNAKLQTSVAHIYACGDVTGPYQFSHMANYQAKLATMNALLPFSRKVAYTQAAWTTFTEPEFAHAGLTEAEARAKYGASVRVYDYDLAKLDRAKTKADDGGLIKLITDRKGRVLGAHIVADRAGELVCQVQTLKHFNIPFARLQAVIHPYPSYADALRQLAQQVYLDRLFNSPIVAFLMRLKARFGRTKTAR